MNHYHLKCTFFWSPHVIDLRIFSVQNSLCSVTSYMATSALIHKKVVLIQSSYWKNIPYRSVFCNQIRFYDKVCGLLMNDNCIAWSISYLVLQNCTTDPLLLLEYNEGMNNE